MLGGEAGMSAQADGGREAVAKGLRACQMTAEQNEWNPSASEE